MLKKTFFAALLLTLTATNLEAQTQPVDHWATRVECEAATSAPYYKPSIISKRPTGRDEVIVPHPTGGCFEIDLPDRLTERFPIRGRGWVRLAPGTPMVYDSRNHSVKRLAECDNDIYAEAPFGEDSNPFAHKEGVVVPAPGNSVQRPTISDQARDAADRAELERLRELERRRDPFGPPNGFERNWKKIVGGAAILATIVAVTAALADGGMQQQQQQQQ